eukprot:1161632-Pelagomonas_calceolata.AAC.4
MQISNLLADVRRMEAELEEKRAAAMCTVELQRVSEETPAVESLPFGKTVEQEFTESPLESRETGPRCHARFSRLRFAATRCLSRIYGIGKCPYAGIQA